VWARNFGLRVKRAKLSGRKKETLGQRDERQAHFYRVGERMAYEWVEVLIPAYTSLGNGRVAGNYGGLGGGRFLSCESKEPLG